ncbi:MAG: transposase [Phycisphaerales bacterium JB038]
MRGSSLCRLQAVRVLHRRHVLQGQGGVTKARKGVKITILVDARGLPVAVDTMSASPHESTLVQGLFDFMLTSELPERIIGNRAYDSDRLDDELAEEGVEMIAPHRSNR